MPLRPIVRALVVPVLGLSIGGLREEGPAASRKVVNVNNAGIMGLGFLPGVGEVLALRIIDHRIEHGPFRRPEDLMQVKGIGEKFFATIKPYVVVTGPTTLTDKVRSR